MGSAVSGAFTQADKCFSVSSEANFCLSSITGANKSSLLCDSLNDLLKLKREKGRIAPSLMSRPPRPMLPELRRSDAASLAANKR
jgi:hypothetical protein